EEELSARDLRELWPQTLDYLVRRHALGYRLKRHEYRGRVTRSSPTTTCSREANHTLNRRILLDDSHHLPQLFTHRLKGDALIGLHPAVQSPIVLLRKKSFGHEYEQRYIKANCADEK